MTTAWTDDLELDGHQPVPYVLTAAGWSAGRGGGYLRTQEAAARRGWSAGYVARLCHQGDVQAVRVAGQWLIDGPSLDAYAARPRPPRAAGRRHGPHRSVPAEPLLQLVAARGGFAAAGGRIRSADERAYYRARRSGRLTLRAADHLAIRLLGLTPGEVWGTAWDDA